MNNSIPKFQPIRKLRPSLYQMPAGELVGFGPLEAKRGNGYVFCYNCNVDDCLHIKAITQAWLDGLSVEAQTIPFNGVAPATEDDQIDDYALPQVTL